MPDGTLRTPYNPYDTCLLILFRTNLGNQEINNSCNQTAPSIETEEYPKREGVWGKIRETFASYFHNGDAIDKSWTAKLEAKIDESSNTIHLQAPSVFIRDWIENNYKSYIEKASLENGFELIVL